MHFSQEQIEDMFAGLAEVRPKFRALQERIVLRQFETDGAREHADHGLCRRLGVLTRCVEQVFTLLPPHVAEVPEKDTTQDAIINIQSFILNAFGCCENIAWIWVHERNIRRPDGTPLRPTDVGLGANYRIVRSNLTQGFQSYLDQRARWFAHLKDFRDALAHRIPLYIPPFSIDPAVADRFRELEQVSVAALFAGQIDEYERLRDEQMALRHFSPIMTHSLIAGAPHVVFHPQLLADFNTIEELVGVSLDELDR